MAVLDARLPAGQDLFGPDDLPFVVAFASASAVGAVLAFKRPGHPVGWLFLALGLSVVLSGIFDGYRALGDRPGTALAAVLGEAAFIPWFVLLALILQLTPTGRPLWPRLTISTVAIGTLWYLSALIPALDLARTPAGVLTAAGLVAAGFSLLVRFHRSTGTERKRLLWLAVAVVPLPAFVVLAFAAGDGRPLLLAFATSGFIVLIPVATGLSIARYHLYDVERVLSRAVTYLLVSGVLVLTFAAVVFTAGHVIGERGDSPVPAVLGTLAAVALAGPAYRAFQETVDRRFNRRRFDTLRRIREFVRDPTAQGGFGIQDVLRDALGDPALRTAYWVDDRGQWVTDAGQAIDPDPGELAVRRLGREVARIAVGPATDRELAEAAANEALPELENAGLRAAISLQLVEVRESRARIAAAQLAERRRIERDLHDGAQQRLLALALNLRAAQLNGLKLDEAVEAAIIELQGAVSELRELANGLQPVGQAGLAIALDDLAARLPLPVELEVVDERFAPAIEATAWFIVCEAMTNAVKHADATQLEVAVTRSDRRLAVRVDDNGRGGADANGSGLRGIADRAEAIGGRLTVGERPGGGTRVVGELPCEW
ncbi:sensor histidine kinase [Kribbella caucasensis]|uniref:sensor histidine kinase n=1 Tax=Kribbella caucasensis TaxID=2512215 RepID=UPI001414E8BB|nr:histidine kinase [Kribbella sp. VKM Ac-2527]